MFSYGKFRSVMEQSISGSNPSQRKRGKGGGRFIPTTRGQSPSDQGESGNMGILILHGSLSELHPLRKKLNSAGGNATVIQTQAE